MALLPYSLLISGLNGDNLIQPFEYQINNIIRIQNLGHLHLA